MSRSSSVRVRRTGIRSSLTRGRNRALCTIAQPRAKIVETLDAGTLCGHVPQETIMGDKGGKKDKDKSKQQQAKKQDEKKQGKSGPRVK